MNTTIKASLISNIIESLNAQIKAKNKKLCDENLHYKQLALHGGDMFLQLSFLSDNELNKIARAAGV
jgi:hypothetical protein